MTTTARWLLLQRSGTALALGAVAVLVALAVVAGTATASRGEARPAAGASPTAWSTEVEPPAPGESLVMTVGAATARVDMPTGAPVGIAAVFAPGAEAAAFMDSAPVVALRDAGWIVATSDARGSVPNEALAIGQFYRFLHWVTGITGQSVGLHLSTGSGSEVSLAAIAYAGLSVPCWFAIDPQADIGRAARAAAREGVAPADVLPRGTRYDIVSMAESPSTPFHLTARRLVGDLQASGLEVTVTDVRKLDVTPEAVGAQIARRAAGCAG